MKLKVKGRTSREVKKMDKVKGVKEKGEAIRPRSERFTWHPADIKVLDEKGEWIRGDEFLDSLKRGDRSGG